MSIKVDFSESSSMPVPDPHETLMTPRRRSREVALQLLYMKAFQSSGASELETAPRTMAHDFIRNFEIPQVVSEYGSDLFCGVCENQEAIDRLIEGSSRHWTVSRMSLVDLSLIRIATYEMALHPDRLKPNIVINEAVDLARIFGSTDSASFVNGILDQIARQL